MEKICRIIKVLEEKKVKIRMFYLIEEADIWWNTVKDRLIGSEFTWSKFLDELKAKFCPITVQRYKKTEFTELRMTGSMTIMHYASKFTQVCSTEEDEERRFEEGLVFYIHTQLVGQPIHIYQELYKRAVEVERVNQKKLAPAPPHSQPTGLVEPCEKC